MSPGWWSGSHQSGFAKAVVPLLVADDQVIEQRQVEHVGRGAQPQRQPRVVRDSGVGSPLGWLWTTIRPVVPGVRHAGTKTSGIETGVLARVPRDSTCQASRRFFVERHATAKTSTGWSASSGARIRAAVRGSVRTDVVGRRRRVRRGHAAADRCTRVHGRDGRERVQVWR